jgi:hypothetical protein
MVAARDRVNTAQHSTAQQLIKSNEMDKEKKKITKKHLRSLARIVVSLVVSTGRY